MLFRSKTSWLGQEAVVEFFDTDAGLGGIYSTRLGVFDKVSKRER